MNLDFIVACVLGIFSSTYLMNLIAHVPTDYSLYSALFDVTALFAWIGIICVLSFAYLLAFNKLKPFFFKLLHFPNDVRNLLDTPKEIDEIKQILNTFDVDTNHMYKSRIDEILEILSNIKKSNDILKEKKIGIVFTEIYKDIAEIKNALKIGKYPCIKCNKFLEAKYDDIFTVVMREKCEVCDILNLTLFRRKDYICEFCGEENLFYFHHKNDHTEAEIRQAERMFREPY